MGIFDSIRDTIFGKANAAPTQPTSRPSTTSTTTAPAPTPTGPAPSSGGSVDVAAVLERAVAAKKQKLNWRTSIVDLMKALDLDSGLEARKKLAKELAYPGDTKDSAKMNIWLHKAL